MPSLTVNIADHAHGKQQGGLSESPALACSQGPRPGRVTYVALVGQSRYVPVRLA